MDFTPPRIVWKDVPSKEEVQPAFILFQFEGSDEPKSIASLVNGFECKLERLNQTVAHADKVELALLTISLHLHMEFRFGLSGNKRWLLDSDSTLDGSLESVEDPLEDTEDTGPRIKDGAYLVFGEWVHCEEPSF